MTKESKTGFFSKSVFSVLAGVMVLLVFFGFFFNQRNRNVSALYASTALNVRTYSIEAQNRFVTISNSLEMFAQNSAIEQSQTERAWTEQAEFLRQITRGIDCIAWTDTTRSIQYIIPSQAFDYRIGQQTDIIAIEPDQIRLWIPGYNNGKLNGFLFVILRLDALIAPAVDEITQQYMIRIDHQGMPLFFSQNWETKENQYISKEVIDLKNERFYELSIAPTDRFIRSELWKPIDLLIFGFLCALAVSVAVHFAQTYVKKSQMLEISKKELLNYQIQLEAKNKELGSINAKTNRFNQDIIKSANEGIIVYDQELRYKTWNPYMEKLTGITSNEVIGEKAVEVFPWLAEEGIIENLKMAMSRESVFEKIIPFETQRSGKSGWIRDISGSLLDEKGEIIGVLALVQDITEQRRYQEDLIYFGYHDQLTGVYNRRFFEEELRRLDTAETLPLSVIMTDINGLKVINDSFGHAAGDELLKKAATVLKSGSRADDIICRLGGDEFIVLLPKTTPNEALTIANKLKELSGKEKIASIEMSVSYGYATKTSSEENINDILANAENYMYRHKLYERSSMRSKTIDIIMKALFEKSKRESMHSARVSNICGSIAEKMNFTKDEIDQIRIAGLIHDIGKISIDEKILNKEGSLTNDEWQAIQKHPESSWRILSSSDEFSDLAQVVLDHHEKWDGRGYPNGLKGDEIPIGARIIAIADSYDAMTSKRTYKEPISKDVAIAELLRCAGTQFDPAIVDVFVKQVLVNTTSFE